MPTTVLHITDAAKIEKAAETKNDAKPEDKAPEKKAEHAGETVKKAAEQTKSKQTKEEKVDTPVEVSTIVHEAPGPDVIAAEAEKGYDLMLIGLEKTTVRGQDFHESVTALAQGFKGPLGITLVRGDLEENPRGKMNILVPINGTEPSRRAAEVAITMARANKAPLTVLYVAVRSAGKVRRDLRTRSHENAILKDIVAIADGYNMSIRTAVVADSAADEAILKEAKRRKNNLIVMGVGRRPGEKLFFGDTASALMKGAGSSLFFLAS
jgi:nucleotide-binding universal stress UspA family protein